MTEEFNNDTERIKALSDESASKLLQQEKFRVRTKEVVEECLETVSFMRKIQEYASDEIDKRLYKSLKFYISIILTTILTVIIFLIKILPEFKKIEV